MAQILIQLITSILHWLATRMALNRLQLEVPNKGHQNGGEGDAWLLSINMSNIDELKRTVGIWILCM